MLCYGAKLIGKRSLTLERLSSTLSFRERVAHARNACTDGSALGVDSLVPPSLSGARLRKLSTNTNNKSESLSEGDECRKDETPRLSTRNGRRARLAPRLTPRDLALRYWEKRTGAQKIETDTGDSAYELFGRTYFIITRKAGESRESYQERFEQEQKRRDKQRREVPLNADQMALHKHAESARVTKQMQKAATELSPVDSPIPSTDSMQVRPVTTVDSSQSQSVNLSEISGSGTVADSVTSTSDSLSHVTGADRRWEKNGHVYYHLIKGPDESNVAFKDRLYMERARRKTLTPAIEPHPASMPSSSDTPTSSSSTITDHSFGFSSFYAPSLSPSLDLDQWKSDWGSDELAPKDFDIIESHSLSHQDDYMLNQLVDLPETGHVESGQEAVALRGSGASTSGTQLPPIPYIRQVGNFIEPKDGPVLQDLDSISEHKPVAQLSHNLDRVLFNPGVHWLQDPRSRVYNFNPVIQAIPPVNEFAFERLQGFIPSSADNDLHTLAKREGRPFAGSTSSLTGVLSHLYFLISGDKPVNTMGLSTFYNNEARNFTPGQRMPVSLLLRYADGVYSTDSSGYSADVSDKNVLTWMGTMLENFLTKDEAEFAGYMRANPAPEGTGEPMKEAYRYSKSDKFVMRSQLDCVDKRLPGTGVFDIKTRAALPIRVDQLNWEENSGYQICYLTGPVESFEKEYYDLIRSAFLKYSFQVRIGNMDGVFVAYHNTAEIFGFQYISLDEMDTCLFGGRARGTPVFEKCVKLMEAVYEQVIRPFPNQTISLTVETLELTNEMKVWVQPASKIGEKGPIAEFIIKVDNFIDKQPVSGRDAVKQCLTSQWTMMYYITQSAESPSVLHANRHAALERQKRAIPIPTGIESMKKMKKYWKKIDHGGKRHHVVSNNQPRKEVAFDPKRFTTPSKQVSALRQKARTGKLRADRRKALEAGKPKVVWGMPGWGLIPELARPVSDQETREVLDGDHVLGEISIGAADELAEKQSEEVALDDSNSLDAIFQESVKMMDDQLRSPNSRLAEPVHLPGLSVPPSDGPSSNQ